VISHKPIGLTSWQTVLYPNFSNLYAATPVLQCQSTGLPPVERKATRVSVYTV